MPRRRVVSKRELPADGVYGSPLVTKFINCMMWSGKKSVAENVVYDALEIIREYAHGVIDDDAAQRAAQITITRAQKALAQDPSNGAAMGFCCYALALLGRHRPAYREYGGSDC